MQSKIIWITGASSGIGEALVYQLIGENVNIIISARRIAELERVKGNCAEKLQKNIRILELDLSKTGELENKVREAESLFGGIDIH